MKNHEGFCVLRVLNPLVRRRDMVEKELRIKPAIPRVGPEGGRVPPEVESAIQRARGGGQPLEDALKEQMSTSLGHDFSEVRVHSGPGADELNRQLSARAFTIGSDIFFTRGAYDPDSISGRELIAHELIHVVQQRNGRVPKNGDGMTVLPAANPSEYEANALADKVAGSINVRCKPIVQRVGTEDCVVQRNLESRVKNIDGRLGQNKFCLNAVLIWIYDELHIYDTIATHPSKPNDNEAMWDANNKIKKLVLNGNAFKYTKKKDVSVNAGDVLVFYDGSVRHACIVISKQVIGGYNQVGWFKNSPATNYDLAPLKDLEPIRITPELPTYSKAIVPLKGFRDEKTKNKKQIQDFRRIMGKDRTTAAQASEYASFWRWQAANGRSQGHGRSLFCAANRLSVERIE